MKLRVTYKAEFIPGLLSRFTLFGEGHDGRRFSFLMTDPTAGRNPTFGTTRDDALAYIPNLNAPNPSNPLAFTTNGATVIFDNAASLANFQALVKQFHLPLGGIVPRGFGQNRYVNRFEFQFARNLPSPIRGHELMFTIYIQNISNLIDKNWGIVKEYANARAGGALVNAQCDDANGVAAGTSSAVCAT